MASNTLKRSDKHAVPGYTFYNSQTQNLSVQQTPDYIDLQRFNSSYYSGLDMSVYFGEIFMDEIINLQYQEQEQVRANYGYADYIPRSFTHGSRLVQGSFTINYKDSGYLLKLINYLRDKGAQEAAIKALAKTRENISTEDVATAAVISKAAIEGDFTLEDFVQRGNNTTEANGQNHYKNYMDALDKAVWGETTKGYESTNTEAALRDMYSISRPRYDTGEAGFDLVIKFGQPEDTYSSETGSTSYGTVETIKNCHIMGMGKVVDDSGRNVLESYTFIGATL